MTRNMTRPSHPEPTLDLDVLITINHMMTVGQVVPAVAHELNNTFQVIGGLVELLSSRSDIPSDVLTRLQRIGHHTDRAVDRMRDLQRFARQEPGESAPADARAVAERALALRRYQFSKALVDAAVEPGGTGVLVQITPRQLQLVILNLIINAEQALAGRPGGMLRVGVTRAENCARVTVTDNGPGVPAVLRDRIFEPFFSTRGPAAAGIGLAAARGVARRHAGDLRLLPSEEGAVFVLELPT